MRLCVMQCYVMQCHVMQHVRVWHDLLFFICPKSPAASSGCFNKGLYMTSDEDFISLSKFFCHESIQTNELQFACLSGFHPTAQV